MATKQEEFHGAVRQVKAKVTAERGAMAGGKAEGEEAKTHIASVQTKWAEFVTALAGARKSHGEYVTSLGAAAAHRTDKLATAQAGVEAAQGETEKSYNSLIKDIRHPQIQRFATLLGALGESVKAETTVVAQLGENYKTMNQEAALRTQALDDLHSAAEGYDTKRLTPQAGIIEQVPKQYDAMIGGTVEANKALDAYIAST